jgi:hypothetical protein
MVGGIVNRRLARESKEALGGMACDEMQGYLFSKPLPPDEFTAFLCVGRRRELGRGQHGPFYGQPGLSSLV